MSDPARTQLTVLMPLFNEAEGLRGTFEALHRHLVESGFGPEYVFVDDASTDDTLAIVEEIASSYDDIHVVRHPENRGPCSGLKTGPEVATRDWILLMSADLPMPLSDIETLWKHRADGDVILGYIGDRGTRDGRRRLQSGVYTALVNALFATELRQVNYIALYRREVFEAIELTARGVALHAEILVRALRAGFAIAQVPVGYQPRKTGEAAGSKPRVILKTLGEVLRLRIDLLRESRRSIGERRP